MQNENEPIATSRSSSSQLRVPMVARSRPSGRHVLDPRPRLDEPLAGSPGGERIFERFLAACRARPEATAIVHERGAWSYAQVERASRALALALLDAPAENDVVALHAHRGPELVVAMLACLRAGLTFAVLDAAYPAERLTQLLEVARPGRFVAIGPAARDAEVLARLSLPRARYRLDDEAMARLLRTDVTSDGSLDQASARSIAYLLFTSGTTGVPRCIETAHAPLVHFVDWYVKAFAVDARARVSMLSGLGHDPVLRDVFVPLSAGAELHVPAQAVVLDPPRLHAWMAASGVTHAHVTPQLARLLCAGGRDQAPLARLAYVFSGGDTLRTRQAKELLAAAPAARVVNFYGSTETPQAMGHHVFDPRADGGAEVVPVGRGIRDVQLLVVDDALAVAAPGARGQIAIRTRFLSAGYRGDAALTARKFRPNPLAQDPADQLYLTGDVGHFRADGAVVVEGRLDDQVKIRGFRVEPGDVVRHLERVPAVKEAVVLAARTPDGENQLVAYVVARPGEPTDAAAASALREAVGAMAPAYLVPARIVWVPAFPLLPNGKLDRAALAALEAAGPPAPALATPLDPLEAQLVERWKARLSRPSIDPGASFVELGGDSLSFIEAALEVEALLGWLPPDWEKQPIRQLARERRAVRSPWTRVDASVLLRALSIIAVVAGHLELPDLRGSVRALFVVSGMSFGRYLVPQVLASQRVGAILRLVAKIAVPTVLYALVVNLVFHRPWWPGLFLGNNWVSPLVEKGGIGFWFVDVLLQSLLLLAFGLSFAPVRRRVARDAFGVALAATVIFAVVSWASSFVWDTTALADRLPHHYLGAMCLGWAVVNADSAWRKALVAGAMVLTFAVPAWRSDALLWFPFAATTFLLLVPRVTLPRQLGRAVQWIAGASLYIYLLDHQVAFVLGKLGLGAHPLVMLVLAVLAGVAAQKVWDHVVVARVLGRRRAEAPAAV